MNIGYEFSKVKDSFSKVKKDMHALVEKINVNYDEFIMGHKGLAKQIEILSLNLKEHIENFKHDTKVKKSSNKELISLQKEVKELKEELSQIMEVNFKISSVIEDVKKNKSNISAIKEKLQSSELEIYLLKERILEKNIELKQMKEISSHILKVIEELSTIEIGLLNKKEGVNGF